MAGPCAPVGRIWERTQSTGIELQAHSISHPLPRRRSQVPKKKEKNTKNEQNG